MSLFSRIVESREVKDGVITGGVFIPLPPGIASILLEIRGSKVSNYAWRTPNRRAAFRAGKIAYEVTFKPTAKAVEVDFAILPAQSPEWVQKAVANVGEKGIVLDPRTKPRQVFATVLAVIEDYLKRNKPARVEFEAVEPSRKRLYKAILKRRAPKWGYEQVPGAVSSEFVLVRKTTEAVDFPSKSPSPASPSTRTGIGTAPIEDPEVIDRPAPWANLKRKGRRRRST